MPIGVLQSHVHRWCVIIKGSTQHCTSVVHKIAQNWSLSLVGFLTSMQTTQRHPLEVAVLGETRALANLKLYEKTLLSKLKTLDEALHIAHTDRDVLRGTHFTESFLHAKRHLNIRINQLKREHLFYTAQYYELHCVLLAAELHLLKTRLCLAENAIASHSRGERSCPSCGRRPKT
jgi:hypothetical protein